MRRTTHLAVIFLAGTLAIADGARAQVITREPRRLVPPRAPAQAERPAIDQRKTPLLQLDPATLLSDQLPEGYLGVQRNLDLFQGFPNYPPGWPTPEGWAKFGEYPSAFPVDGKPSPRLVLPRSLPPQPGDWPSWFDSRARAGESAYEADMALLLRSIDRVWYKASGEAAFVPLAFYDKGRVVRTGDAIHVRFRGGFELHFHGGGYLRAKGRCEVRVASLDESVNEIELSDYAWVRLVTRLQPLQVTLPDGSRLAMQGNSLVQLTRENGLGLIMHTGEGVVRLESKVGPVTIPHGHRVKIFLAKGGSDSLSIELRLDSGLKARRDGRVLEVTAEDDGGAVLWGGLRVTLKPGQRLRVDPLVGAEFPEHLQRRQ